MQKRLGLDLEVPDDFGHWLAGFVAGEGCFGGHLYSRANGYPQLQLTFAINLRIDDEPILRSIRETLGVGKIYQFKGSDHRSPATVYKVQRIGDLYHIIVPLFEKYPLRAKKMFDFEVWKKIVSIKYHEGGLRGRGSQHGSFPTPESYWDKIKPLIKQLQEGRKLKV